MKKINNSAIRNRQSAFENKVHIIGIGPGSKDYLLPIAKREIKRADCLVGGKRLLSLFQHQDKEKISLENNFKEVIWYIKENRAKKKIVVLVSGDPGLYSFLGQISQVLKKEDYAVIPGISTLQIAFARVGETWQDTKIISLHGRRSGSLAEEVKTSPKVFLLTDLTFPPERIAAHLLDKGVENKKAIILENLSYPNERIVDTDLKNLSQMRGFGLCVMLILTQKTRGTP